jgi:predicted methyltransferase
MNSEIKTAQNNGKVKPKLTDLFQQEVSEPEKVRNIKVVLDNSEKQNYSMDEVINSIILGDALDVLKKLPDEIFDMIFIDPPYFLQLPKKN